MDQQVGARRLGALLSILIFYLLVVQPVSALYSYITALQVNELVTPILRHSNLPDLSGLWLGAIKAVPGLFAGLALWFWRRRLVVWLTIAALWCRPISVAIFYALNWPLLHGPFPTEQTAELPSSLIRILPMLGNVPDAIFLAGGLTVGLLNSDRVKAIYR